MAYDERLAQRVREIMHVLPGFAEKKMFGGVGFMLNGNMACGVNKDDLIVRVGPGSYTAALEEPYTKVFDMTGRPMKGWVVVKPAGCESDSGLQVWVARGVNFAASLSSK